MSKDDLVHRLRERARIRRQIPTRKSVQEGKTDRIADVLEEAAEEIAQLRIRVEQAGRELKDPDGWDDCIKWEFFCDVSYYDLWAVRPVGETRLGYCFHMNAEEEAKGLCDLLNRRKYAPITANSK